MQKSIYRFIICSILLILIPQNIFSKEKVISPVTNSITKREIHIDNTPEDEQQKQEIKTDKTSTTFIEYKKKFKTEFGKYGEFYANAISESEDIKIHFDYFAEIKKLYKDIQGCEFKNPALVLGLTHKRFLTKL